MEPKLQRLRGEVVLREYPLNPAVIDGIVITVRTICANSRAVKGWAMASRTTCCWMCRGGIRVPQACPGMG